MESLLREEAMKTHKLLKLIATAKLLKLQDGAAGLAEVKQFKVLSFVFPHTVTTTITITTITITFTITFTFMVAIAPRPLRDSVWRATSSWTAAPCALRSE